MISSLKNHFLIAMPTLLDPHFFHAVTYICDHTPQGAVGLVINQPLNLSLGDVFEQMGIHNADPSHKNQMIFAGGPNHRERGFVLHRQGTIWQSTTFIGNDIFLTTSPDILQALSKNQGPAETFVALGYATWQAGQLEKEITENVWLFGPASSDIIFEIPFDGRWKAAARVMGIDIEKISPDVGHG